MVDRKKDHAEAELTERERELRAKALLEARREGVSSRLTRERINRLEASVKLIVKVEKIEQEEERKAQEVAQVAAEREQIAKITIGVIVQPIQTAIAACRSLAALRSGLEPRVRETADEIAEYLVGFENFLTDPVEGAILDYGMTQINELWMLFCEKEMELGKK